MRSSFLVRSVTLSLALAAGAAQADGDALVIGNNDFGRFQTFFGAARVEASAEALRAAGFDAVSVRNASFPQMHIALRDFLAGLEPGQGPVVIVLSGDFQHSAMGSYLLPTEEDEAITDAARFTRSFAVDTALAILAAHPGQAMLILGEAEGASPANAYMKPGLGDLDIPQGVTVLQGPAQDVARFVSREVTEPGVAILERAEAYELDVAGFAPRGFVLVPEGARVADVTERDAAQPEPDLESARLARIKAQDDAAWEVAQQADTAEGYRAYLTAFGEGQHADAARQRATAIEAEPFYAERRAEEALQLDRDARRDVQRDLVVLGYNTRGIDGIFGRGSRAAIQGWQEKAGLPASGYLSRDMIARLDVEARRRAEELEAEAAAREKAQREEELAYWRQVEQKADEASLRAYLERYPDGRFAGEARDVLATLEAQRASRAATQDRRAWSRAKEAGTVAAYRNYLSNFPQGAFANEAKARLAEFDRADQAANQAASARRGEQALGLPPIALQLVEARLSQLGLEPGNIDGKFDSDTRRALRRYQKRGDLEPTGYLDQQTVSRLLSGAISR